VQESVLDSKQDKRRDEYPDCGVLGGRKRLGALLTHKKKFSGRVRGKTVEEGKGEKLNRKLKKGIRLNSAKEKGLRVKAYRYTRRGKKCFVNACQTFQQEKAEKRKGGNPAL